MSAQQKPRYRFVGTWEEDGVRGYEWRWTIANTHGTPLYDEVAVCFIDDFWSGRAAFGHYMATPKREAPNA